MTTQTGVATYGAVGNAKHLDRQHLVSNGDDASDGDLESNSEQDHLLASSASLDDTRSKRPLSIDPLQDNKATELCIFSFERPHMRGFHGAWMTCFAAIFVCFSFAPLLPQVERSLNLSKSDIWYTNTLSVVGAVIMRLTLGPICDVYGARTVITGLLALCSIPCFFSGTVTNLKTLAIVRTLVGFVGGVFPLCQFWTACHFTKEVAGSAMALVGGWGATGVGITQFLMGSFAFPFCKEYIAGGDVDMAWRISFVFPATVALSIATFFYFYSDDCAKGNYRDLKKDGSMKETSALVSYCAGMTNVNSWLLFIEYGASFGVELTMANGAAMYFHDKFGQSIESAASIATLYGLTNLFSRALGGFLSDKMNQCFGLRGRLIAHMAVTFCEGLLTLCFASCSRLDTSIVTMMLFAIFVQGSMGTCYAIVPYVDPPNTGTVAGIVGAGGPVAATFLAALFGSHTYEESFQKMGIFACIISLLTPLISIPGYSGLLFVREREDKQANTMEHEATIMLKKKAQMDTCF